MKVSLAGLLVTLVLATVPGDVSVAASTDVSGDSQQPMLGQPAPSFRLRGLDGNTLALEELRDGITVIHFAASW